MITVDAERTIERGGGWTWIFEVSKIEKVDTAGVAGMASMRYYVRFDILGLEVLGILVLAGAALLITKKQ